jgi:hypothetical protein
MTSIGQTALARLEQEGRLLNPVFKGTSSTPGRFLFRGEVALKFAKTTSDEKRPPELKAEQVLVAAQAGDPKLPFFAGYLLSFEGLRSIAEVLGDLLSAEGRYFIFCGNIDLSARYQVTLGQTTFYVLPLEESTVYNEMLDLLRIDKNALKKLDTPGKLEAIASGAAKFRQSFEAITYERGLELMGPVRDPGENRPV